MATKLTEHFTLEEMTVTSHGSNVPNATEKQHLLSTATMLETLRQSYGKGIHINSAFRCARVNKLAGGSATSSHLYGYAADTKPTDGDMKTYQRAVLKWAEKAPFDQIILEKTGKGSLASWIHIGYKHGRTGAQRRQILYTTDCKTYHTVAKGSKFYV